MVDCALAAIAPEVVGESWIWKTSAHSVFWCAKEILNMLSWRAIVVYPTLLHRHHPIAHVIEPYALIIFKSPRVVPGIVSSYGGVHAEKVLTGIQCTHLCS